MNVKVQQKLCTQEGYERVTLPKLTSRPKHCHPEQSEEPMQLARGKVL